MKKSFDIIRIFDLFISILGLMILIPVLILIAIALWLESRGRIIFKQERIGKGGCIFTIYKFRTMRQDPANDLMLTLENDLRITRIGRFLRKTRLDELPQLANVLKGEMSIVGPRPEVKKYVERYTEDQKKILMVKPGITDLASIHFRNEAKLLMSQTDPEKYYEQVIIPRKIDYNMKYINNRNFISYFKIILKTLLSAFR